MSAKKTTKTAAKPRKATTAKAKTPKASATAKVLASSSEPLTTKQMIEAMATKGLWTSPGGKTPHATLYSAIAREISVKGNDARFVKAERGKFAAKK